MTIPAATSASNVTEPAESDAATSLGDLAGPPSAARQVVAAVLLTVVAIGSVLLLPPLVAGGILITLAILYLARKLVFSWVGGLTLLVGVIMFIPVRRYALPIPLPFALEPYRVVLILLLVAVVGALL